MGIWRTTGKTTATIAGAIVLMAAGSGAAWAGPGAVKAPGSTATLSETAPALEQSPCFTWTGPGMCMKFSNQDLRDWEAVGLVATAGSAAAVSEQACAKLPGSRKAACKAAVAIVATDFVITLRQAISEGRCLSVKASLNPVGNAIERPKVVDC